MKQINKPNKISPVKMDITTLIAAMREPQKGNWFSFSVSGMSKLSNALKEGVFGNKKGVRPTNMATQLGHKNEDKGFSFFL